jgi:hypothetical protein
MNGTKYLLDTNTILYMLSGNQILADRLHQKSLYASFISEIELFGYKGLTTKEEKSVRFSCTISNNRY